MVSSPLSSEVTQPPKSPSAVSSQERRPSSLGPTSETEVSQLTQSGTSDHGRGLTPEKDPNEPKANVEVSPITEGRLSPTSIDSTPTPSPMVIPRQLAASGQPTPIPNTVSGSSYATNLQVSRTNTESPFLFSPVSFPRAAHPE